MRSRTKCVPLSQDPVMTTRPRPTRADARAGIPIDSPGAPQEGDDAGDASDLHEERIARVVQKYRSAALRDLKEAQKKLAESRGQAEELARRSLHSAARSVWWAEGTALEERQHALLDKCGRWTRRTFGCSLTFRNGQYQQSCPVAIAHKRIGMSPGMIADRECSICGEDLSECPHLRSRTYWVRGGPGGTRDCPVCRQSECGHRADRLYRVGVVAIIREVRELVEVSIVDRPANPEARLTSLPVDNADLRASLGPNFLPGMPVSCDRCLSHCSGFETLTDRGN
jgi:hypothetical protein